MSTDNTIKKGNLDFDNGDYDFDMVASVVDGFWEMSLTDGKTKPEDLIRTSELTNINFDLPQNLSIKTWRSLLHPDDRERFLNQIWTYLANRSNTDFYTIEYRLKKADGTYRWVQNKGRSFRNSEGIAYKLTGVLSDITDQKELLVLKNNLEQEVEKKTIDLQKIINFQTTMFNSSNFAIVSTDTNGLITTFNQGAEKMLGYKAKQVIKQANPSTLWHDQKEVIQKAKGLSEKYNEKITAANFFTYLIKNKNKIYREQWTLLRSSGERFPAILTLSALRNETGELIGALAIIEDITKLEKIEQALKIHKERYDFVINNSSDYVWLMSWTMKALYLAPSCQRFLGYTEAELMTMRIDEIHPKKTVFKIKSILKKVLRAKKKNFRVQDEFEYIHKNGNIIIADVKAYAIYNQKGNPIAVAGISRDITARKENEKKQNNQNNKIKQAYQDITDSIHYAKTIQEALLTKKKIIDSYFDKYFILFEPKEEVSGDFYYVKKRANSLTFAVADCTGHGVPGGFLTMLGITFLDEISKSKNVKSPAKMLDLLREKMKNTFKSFGNENQNGLDITLCQIDTQTNILHYSGANNPLWIVKKGYLIEYKATHNPVGFYPKEIPFEGREIQIEKNDMIYLFSDGFRDQFGGQANTKYGRKKFRELLLNVHKLPVEKQKKELMQTFQNWKGKASQIDDVTIMGIKW